MGSDVNIEIEQGDFIPHINFSIIILIKSSLTPTTFDTIHYLADLLRKQSFLFVFFLIHYQVSTVFVG